MKKYNFSKLETVMILLLAIMIIIGFASVLGMLISPIITIISAINFLIAIIKYNLYIDLDIENNRNEQETEEEKIYYDKKAQNLCAIFIWKIVLNFAIVHSIYSILICSCGHHMYSIIPVCIFTIVDIMLYFKKFKVVLEQNKKDNNLGFILTVWVIISSVMYLLLLFGFEKDMSKIHTVVVAE